MGFRGIGGSAAGFSGQWYTPGRFCHWRLPCLSPQVISRADFVWSFSELTFPHQLMRLILTEQIYRAQTILGGEGYHK